MDVLHLMKEEMLRRNLSLQTVKTYLCCVREFLNRCHVHPKSVTKWHIKAYLKALQQKGLCGNTLNVHVNALKFLMEEVLGKRVLFRIKYSKVPKTLPTVLTQEEVVQLFQSINNPKHHLMTILMYAGGLRVSELVHLKIEDLELAKGYGWVRNGKERKDRLFPVAEKIKPVLVEYLEKMRPTTEGWLFRGHNDDAYSARSIHEIIKGATKKAGIRKNVHPHTLRHSFATHLIENGCNLGTVQSLLGHNSADTTLRYIHMVSPKRLSAKSPYDELGL